MEFRMLDNVDLLVELGLVFFVLFLLLKELLDILIIAKERAAEALQLRKLLDLV